MTINDSSAKRRTVKVKKVARQQSAGRSGGLHFLGELDVHPTSSGFVTRLF